MRGIHMSNVDREQAMPYTSMPNILYGFEAFYACSNKMESSEFHCHDFYEFYFYYRGGQYYGIEDDLFRLEPGLMFIIPPFCMHGVSGVGEMIDYERAYLNVSPQTLRLLGCEQIDLDQFFHACVKKGLNHFQLNGEDADHVRRLMRQLQANQHTERQLDRFQNYALLQQLIALICRVVDQSQAATGAVVSSGIMQQVLAYINSHYTQPLKIADLARQFNVSVSYLSHEFVKYTNRSIYDYILYRRVMLAKEMIHSNESLNIIAYQCGFNDYSNFLRMFNKVVGISPREYRNELRRQLAGP